MYLYCRRIGNLPGANAVNYYFHRHISSKKYYETLKRCYEILNVREDSDQETIRLAYLESVKKYHPDSGSPTADIEKFKQIEQAFRIISKKKSQDRWNVEEDQRIKQFDIEHTAPQHRQYLTYEGAGSGTPFQREKQWIKSKAIKAAQNVIEHRLSKTAASENALMNKTSFRKAKHDIKTKYGIDRLVEDLIQESMSKGEFDNLPGKGKPLPSHQNMNPYVDFITHKINQVLIDNGFTPEWITLQKDINTNIDILRNGLLMERSFLGPLPLTDKDNKKWMQSVNKYEKLNKQINSKITHYNLVVPILRNQMMFISLEKEAENILENGKNNTEVNHQVSKIQKNAQNEETSILDLITHLFK